MDPIELVARARLPFLARCPIPEDLDAVTAHGPEEPVRGRERAAVGRVWEAARAFCRGTRSFPH